MTEPYETLDRICSFFLPPPSNRAPCFPCGFGALLSHSHTSVCNGGAQVKSEHLCLRGINCGFGQTFTSRGNRAAGVGSPRVSAPDAGDRTATDVSESGLSLLQYLPMSYGDQCHIKEAQLGFKLKGRAQDLKGACPCGRWPVAPFSRTSQTSLNPYTCTLGMFHPAAQLV